tara:strand:- start:3979 stop:4155 length:177 start_codon:yes stop_codon:yes gene_type:complete
LRISACRFLNCVQQVFGELKSKERELAFRNSYEADSTSIPQSFQGLFRHSKVLGSLFF